MQRLGSKVITNITIVVVGTTFAVVCSIAALLIHKAINYGAIIETQSRFLGATAEKTTDGNVNLKLPARAEAAERVLMQIRNNFHMPLVSDRIAISDLEVSYLRDGDEFLRVYSVVASRPVLLDASDLARLRTAFPNCTLWGFVAIEWNEDVQREVIRFPKGSSITCGGTIPEDFKDSKFADLGSNGITWTSTAE